MKVEHITPFIQALAETFDSRFDMRLVSSPPTVRTGVSPRTWDVSTIAGVVGRLRGAIVLHCPSSVALKLASAACGSQITELDDEVADTMAATLQGILSTALQKAPALALETSTPAVLMGPGHRSAYGHAAPYISIRFESPAGPLEMEVALSER